MNNVTRPLKSNTATVTSAERMFSDLLLGKLFDDPSSNAILKLVKCTDGSVASAGQAVSINVATTNNYDVVLATASTFLFAGAALGAIASSNYGFVQVMGKTLLQTSATLASASKLLIVGATAGLVTIGDFTTASHGARVVGLGLQDGAASGDLIAVVLRPALI